MKARSVSSSCVVLLSLLCLAVSGCDGGGVGLRGMRHQTRTLGNSGGINPNVPPKGKPLVRPGTIAANAAIAQLNPEWVFVGYAALDHLFRDEFGITGANRDPAAEQEVLGSLASQKLALGGNNYAMGMAESLGPEPSKFRALAELTTSACRIAMNDPAVRQKFFPGVTSSATLTDSPSVYDVSFLRLLGRYPEAAEKGILIRMVTDLRSQGASLEGQLQGVCAVILNSLEFAHGR